MSYLGLVSSGEVIVLVSAGDGLSLERLHLMPIPGYCSAVTFTIFTCMILC